MVDTGIRYNPNTASGSVFGYILYFNTRTVSKEQPLVSGKKSKKERSVENLT
jgi:hypothetical protein